MPADERSGESTNVVFAALANPTRREFLDMLLDGERTVVALAERFDMARPSVVQRRSRAIMGHGWVRIAGQLGEVLGG